MPRAESLRPAAAAALAIFASFLASATIASAAPPQLWQACPAGSGAGQCNLPRGVAANPANGHVYVIDQSNARVDEFDPLGNFLEAWGWDVVASGPGNVGSGFEICVPEDGDTCKAGSEGAGTGQFSPIAPGIALDSAGNVYVTDRGFLGNPSLRVQKFSPSGQFLLMFGGEVNETKVEGGTATEAEENLCPVDPGDICKAGTLGTGNGQFGEWALGDFITVDGRGTATATDDVVYVGDQDRIQAFDTEGHYTESLPLPGHTVQSLATDAAGDLYAAYSFEADVRKLTPNGAELASPRFAAGSPSSVAVDAAGQLYAFDSGSILEFDPVGNPLASFGSGEFEGSTGLATNLCPGSESPGDLYATNLSQSSPFLRSYGTPPIGCFKARTLPAEAVEETAATLRGTVNPSGALSSECRFEWGPSTAYTHEAECLESPAAIGEGSSPVPVHAAIGSLTKATTYHFRLLARIGGETERGPDESFKTLGPPLLSAEQTVSATTTEASLKALVNPEGLATTYRFDYTTQAAFEAHGFQGAQSTSSLPAGSDRTDHPATANITGLAPGTIYRWRLIATNSSGQTESAQAHTLITYRPFIPQTDCPNQALPTGASAFLPDCRAYEMVSPLDKNGGDILGGLGSFADPGGYVQAAADGAKLTYGVAFAAFAGEPAGLVFNQYLAQRGGGGWSSEGIHPPLPGRLCCQGLNLGLTREFSAFSRDLCSSWLYDPQDPPLEPDAQQGYPNLYRRQNCGPDAGSLETLTSSPPPVPSGTEVDYVNAFSVQGFSEDTRQVFFVAAAKLNDEAAQGTRGQIYDRFAGEDHLVSVLPSGLADETDTTVGSAASALAAAGGGNLDNAVAKDGSRVYWTSGIGNLSTGVGRIYVRTHPEQGIVAGECDPAGAKACTRAVSAGPGAFYWAAAAEGSRALYSEGEELFEFDLEKAEAEEPPRRLIAHHVLGVSGTSEDLSRIYFVSTDALNEEAQGEEAGKPNLYLREGGAFEFVATLAKDDIGVREPGAISVAYNVAAGRPYDRPTRLTPDGSRIAFESRAPLTGFDNTDPAGGKPAVEVFTYEGGGTLACVSCNPSGARPGGVRELRLPYAAPFEVEASTKVPAAAWIPTSEHLLHASNVLSADGTRLFFNSNDALVPRDTNGAPDVYEWEAPGAGSCDQQSASFFATNDGCLYLISSGQSPDESEFWEADADGSDVFFTTSSSLLPQDPGSVDLYDARVDGGFPQPTVPAACEGEACQSPPAPPNHPTPATSALAGDGNVEGPAARPCPRGKVKKHGKCVKKKHKRHRGRTANGNRGGAR